MHRNNAKPLINKTSETGTVIAYTGYRATRTCNRTLLIIRENIMTSVRFPTRTAYGVPDYAASGVTRPTSNSGVSAFGQKKVLALLAALLLAGCGSMPSLEQLEDQAFISGDWSAVEKRERLIARRIAIQGPQCPAGLTAYCEKRGVQKRCGCVENAEMREMLSWL